MDREKILKEIERLKRELSKSEDKRVLSFSKVKLENLKELKAVRKLGDSDFQKWFNNSIDVNSETELYLKELLQKERDFLKYYNEEDLKINFLAPILNRVDFKMVDLEIRAFYEESLYFETDNFILKGTPDFFVSKGLFQPEAPLFFIQEFKRGIENSFPEPQLVAEMIVGVEISDFREIKGAFIVGSIWNFVVLKKSDNGYSYSVSKNFDSSREDDLIDIFRNLLFIKNEILERGRVVR